jgi:hypothetical protein
VTVLDGSGAAEVRGQQSALESSPLAAASKLHAGTVPDPPPLEIRAA